MCQISQLRSGRAISELLLLDAVNRVSDIALGKMFKLELLKHQRYIFEGSGYISQNDFPVTLDGYTSLYSYEHCVID